MSEISSTTQPKAFDIIDRSYYTLQNAIQRKKFGLAKALIAGGAQVNSPHGQPCNTILHLAVVSRSIGMVKLILRKGASINVKNTIGKTALHLAVESRQEAIIKLLVTKGAEINTIAKDFSSPIQAAIYRCRPEIFDFLVSHGAKIDPFYDNVKILFYFTVKSGKVSMINYFLKHGLVNKEATKNSLRLAILLRNEKVEKLLMEHGFGVHIQFINDSKFVHAVIARGYTKLVNDLLKMGAKINSKQLREKGTGFTVLHTACKHRQFQIVELLILHNMNLNIKDNEGKMAIYYAVTSFSIGIIKLLLTNRANVRNDPDLLIEAAKNQKIELVSLLLDSGADITDCDQFGRTALHAAIVNKFSRIFHPKISKNRLSLVDYLLRRGAHVNARVPTDDTALHMAVQNKNELIVEVLLKHKANVNVSNSTETTPLHLAVQVKSSTIINRLLSCNANVRAADENGATALHFAAKARDLGIIKSILQFEPDVNATDRFTSTPLHYAAKYGPVECVSILLDHNADVNALDIRSWTPLHLAVEAGKIEIVDLLIKSNANVDLPNKDGDTCLHIAIVTNEDIAKLILNHSKDINCINKQGLSPLLIAASRAPSLVECLLECGADVFITDPKGRNAVFLAAKNDSLESVKSLLEKNADVNCTDNEGSTPLLMAIRLRRVNLVNTLLQFNVDVNYSDWKKKTALSYALMNHDPDIIENLLLHGANVNSVNYEGLTPLLEAIYVYTLTTEFMNRLLKFGADPDFKSRIGKTALYIVTEEHQSKLARLLLNYGADMSVTYDKKIALFEMFKFTGSNYDYGNSHCRYRSDGDYKNRYKNFSSHVDECSSVINVYKSHVRKLRAANLYVEPVVIKAFKYFEKMKERRDKGEIYDIDSDDFKSDSDSDEDEEVFNEDDTEESLEIKAMKSERIGASDITFYTFLTSSIHWVARFVKNKDVVDVLKARDYELIFPIYAGMINSRLYRGLDREKLLDECNFFHPFVRLPFNCVDGIFGFLNNQDLRMLAKSYKDQNEALE